MLYTHMNVDLDAVCSLWFCRNVWKRTDPIAFRPANWDGAEVTAEDLVLDIDANGRGFKGIKDANGRVHACFACLVEQHATEEEKKALAPLVAYVDAQDAHGNAAGWLLEQAGGLDHEHTFDLSDRREKELVSTLSACGINAVLRAFQAIDRNDLAVFNNMSIIFDGMLKNGLSRIAAEEEADKAEIIGGRVAIVRDSKHMATNGVLMERGIEAVVFVDGNNLGVTRSNSCKARMAGVYTRLLVEDNHEAAEWFDHPAGFLYARGTRKAPAEKPSKVDPRALAEAVLMELRSQA